MDEEHENCVARTTKGDAPHQGNCEDVVSRGGLEPPTRCLRGSCSTIELPAHRKQNHYCT
jgi:hypothetical protein